MPEEKPKWYKIYEADQASNKYQSWLLQAQENRQLADLSLKPLERADGLIRDKRDWLKSTSIRRIMRNVKSRITINPIDPKAEPHEGAVVEEDMSQICVALWKHERNSYRGPKNLNLDQEVDDWINECMETGMGYLDIRIDAALRNTEFINGLPIYESLDPVNVILDSDARRLKDINHLHIVMTYTKENFEVTFGEDAAEFSDAKVDLHKRTFLYKQDTNQVMSLDKDPKGSPETIDVIETQFIKREMDELIVMPEEQRSKLFLPPNRTGLIFKSDLKRHLEKMKEAVKTFNPPPLDKILKGLDRAEQMRWGVYSTFYAGNKPIKDGHEYFLGNKFTPVPIAFARVSQDSPYGWGAPYFLRDAQKMEILVDTKLAELALKSNKSRVWIKGTIKSDEKKQIGDPLRDVVELPSLAGSPYPIEELMKFESAADAIPLLIGVRGMVHRILNEEYGTHPPTEGALDVSGISGRAIENLAAGSTLMLIDTKTAVERGLREIYERVRNLAAYAIPPQMLIEIAAETDQGRQQLITSGRFYQRISKLNTHVLIDLTTRQEKLFLRSLYFELYKAGKLSEEIFFELVEQPEPKRLSKAIMEHQMRTNAALRVGTFVTQDEDGRRDLLPIFQRYIQTKELLESKS